MLHRTQTELKTEVSRNGSEMTDQSQLNLCVCEFYTRWVGSVQLDGIYRSQLIR